MNIKNTTAVFLICFLSQSIIAQINLDSLIQSLDKEQNDSIRMNAVFDIGDHYAYDGNDNANTYIQQLYDFGKKTGSIERTNQGHDLKALLFSRWSKYDSSDYYYFKIIENVKGDSAKIAPLYSSIAWNYYRQSKFDTMLYYADRSLNTLINNDSSNREQMARVYNMHGIAHDVNQNFEDAIKSYQNSLDIKKELGNVRGQVNTLTNLSIVSGKLGSTDQELKYLEEMIRLAEEIDYVSAIGTGNHALGVFYRKQKKYNTALEYLFKAQKIREENKIMFGLTFTTYVIGNVYRDMEKFSEAEKYYIKGLDYAKQIKNKQTEGNIHANLSVIYTKQGMYAKAADAAENAKLIADQINLIESRIYAYKISSEANEGLGLHKMALKDYKKFSTLLDSSNQTKYDKDVQELQIQYETKENQSVIDKQKIELHESTMLRNRYLTGLITIGLLATLLLYRYQANQKLSNEKIINLEQKQKLMAIDYMVQGQEEERKRIARDLHDGLGGLLASARLQMQSIQKEIEKLSDLKLFSQAEQMIDTACIEVRRIAHDMMPDALVNLGFKDAIEDLATQINASNSLKVNCYFSNIDIDLRESQSIIMYRVIQEIISNTLKHAKADHLLIQVIEREFGYYFTIEDNGIGFDTSQEDIKGIGLKNIKNRVQYLNGKIQILSEANKGTTFEISIPK